MNKRILSYFVIACSLVCIVVYALVRTISLHYAHYTGLDRFFSLLLLGTEFFILLHSVGYFINVLRSYRSEQRREELDRIAHSKLSHEPPVAVLLAARHEPKYVLEATFRAIINMNYQNKEVFLLDDSSDEKFIKEAEDIARELNIHIFRRKERHGAKAGIINDFLKTVSHKYFVIFDADQCPLPEFLNRVVPLMEKDENLAFVQTPQFSPNISNSRVAKAASLQQCVFYEFICEGKGDQGAMFCCGSNVVMRLKAVREVGGFDENFVTEDFATSLSLLQGGWKSLYYDHAIAFGQAPETLGAYFKQQFRWAQGTIAVFRRLIREFLFHPFSLSVRQWWEYFLSGTYYFVGLAFFFFMCFPIAYLFFNVASFFATPTIYLLAFLPYIILSFTIFYSLLKTRIYKLNELFMGQMLIYITFPIHIKAALSALLGRKSVFQVTDRGRGESLSYWKLWPQITMMILSYAACIWGSNRFLYERDWALLINSFWALYHCFILSLIFYFNKQEETK